YDPDSNACALSYNDRPFCSNAELVRVARPHQPVFMHCLSCVPHKMLQNETAGFFLGNLDNKPTTEKSDVPATTVTTTETAESATKIFASKITTVESEEESSSSSVTPAQATTGKSEETTVVAEEASGEESTEQSKPPKLLENIDENATIVESTTEPASTTEGAELTSTLPSIEESNVSAVSSPSEGALPVTSGEQTTTTTEKIEITTHEEASGEEPLDKNALPEVQMNLDETTIASAESTLASSTAVPGNESAATTLGKPVSTTVGAGPTSTLPSIEESNVTAVSSPPEGALPVTSGEQTTTTTEKSEITTTHEEASGEEPLDKNALPEVQMNLDETTTASAESTLASSTAVPGNESAATTLGSEVTATTASPTAEGAVTETTTEQSATEESKGTTPLSEEASGEEVLDKNALPKVQTSLDETTTVSVESTLEPAIVPVVSVTATETSATSSFPVEGSSSPVTLPPVVVTEASGEQTTTETSESTPARHEESSGEGPLDKNALPAVQTSLDETTTVFDESTPLATAEVSATSTISSQTSTPSSTEKQTSTVAVPPIIVVGGEVTTTEKSELATTTQEVGSGEEPSNTNIIPEVQPSLDGTTTIFAESTPETSATMASGVVSSTTPLSTEQALIVTSPATESATGETAGGQSTTERNVITTEFPAEASGEEPSDKELHPIVQANLDETTTAAAESTPEPSPTVTAERHLENTPQQEAV
ncbi:unnamed protein product, partial [Strongylus vulgaris]